jgi:hypothetical protein
MILLIDSGWTVKNDSVKMGASEKVTTNDGTVMLDEPDLFSSLPNGVSSEDAKIIGLSVSFKNSTGTPPSSFDVTFRVWDKQGQASISGSYKLYPK